MATVVFVYCLITIVFVTLHETIFFRVSNIHFLSAGREEPLKSSIVPNYSNLHMSELAVKIQNHLQTTHCLFSVVKCQFKY